MCQGRLRGRPAALGGRARPAFFSLGGSSRRATGRAFPGLLPRARSRSRCRSRCPRAVPMAERARYHVRPRRALGARAEAAGAGPAPREVRPAEPPPPPRGGGSHRPGQAAGGRGRGRGRGRRRGAAAGDMAGDMVGSGDEEAAPQDGPGLAPQDGPGLKRRRKSPRLAAARPEGRPGDEVDSAAQHGALRGKRRGRAQRPAVDPVVEGAEGRREAGRAGAVWFPRGRVGTGAARAPGGSGVPERLSGLGPVARS